MSNVINLWLKCDYFESVRDLSSDLPLAFTVAARSASKLYTYVYKKPLYKQPSTRQPKI